MDTPRFRIGNDLTVLWAINNRDGSPYKLDDKEVRLFVTHPQGREEVTPVLQKLPDGTTNNVIRWDFRGEDQRILGLYTLTVEITTAENHKEIKKDYCEAFSLVGLSCDECEEEGEPDILDGGDLVLSSRLDVYRFGIPKITIGTNGNWLIDGVDSGQSALAGGKGLVNVIYEENDFGNEFVPDSVIDTFNAHAINSLFVKLGGLALKDSLQDVDILEPQLNHVLAFDGSVWRNIPFETLASKYGGGSGGSLLDDVVKRLRTLESWFKKYDDNTIYTDFNFFSTKTLASGGKGVAAGVGDGSFKGITVNGRTYDAVNGIVTLPSYPTKLSELENDLDLSDGISSWYNIADKPYALQFLGSSSQFIKADGSIDSTSYLPLTGGDVESLTIEGNAAIHAGNIGEFTAGSSAKLQTPRKIWGQFFDGTADITGGLLLGNSSIYTAVSGTNVSLFDFYGDGSPLFGYGTAGIGLRTVICGYNVSLAYGKTRTAGLWLNSSGNVTVGATDKAGEQARLYVDGDIMSAVYYLRNNPDNPYLRLLHNDKNWYIQAYQDAMYIGLNAANALKLNGDGTIYCPNDFQASNAMKAHRHATGVATLNVEEFSATYNGSHLYVTSNNASATYSRPLVLQYGYGNVGIGTLVPGYKLDVSGTGHFSGNVVMDGKLTIGGATLEWDGSALKVTGNMYATGTVATGGRGTAGTTSGGALLTDWADLPSDTSSQKLMSLSAYLGNELRADLTTIKTNISGTYSIWGRTFWSNGRPVDVISSPILAQNGGLYACNYNDVSTMLIYYLSTSTYSEFILGSATASNSEVTRLCGYPIAFHVGSRSTTAVAKVTTGGIEVTSGKTIKIGDVTLSASEGILYANGVAIN